MSIISKVGRRSAKVRVLNGLIHTVLILGALTMVYPFLLMLSSSLKSNVDSVKLSLLPKYLYDDTALFQKYLESRYNEESSRLADNYAGRWLSFSEAELPELPDPALCKDWQEFISSRPQGVYDYYVAEHYGRGVYPLNQRRMRKLLRDENHNDLTEFNRKYNTGAQSWEQIVVEEKDILGRNYVSTATGYLGRFRAFKKDIEERHRNYINLDGAFVQMELAPAFSSDLDSLNAALGTDFNSWQDIFLAERCPTPEDPLRGYWLHYVREALNIHHLSLEPSAGNAFQAMLGQKYTGIGMLNSTWHTAYRDFSEVAVPDDIPDSGALVEDLTYFVENLAAPEDLRVRNIGNEFRDWLRAKYGNIGRLQQNWRDGYPEWTAIPLLETAFVGNLGQNRDWELFARSSGLAWAELLPASQTDYHSFLGKIYTGQGGKIGLAALNRDLGTRFTSLEEIVPPPRVPENTKQAALWYRFIKEKAQGRQLKLVVNEASRQAWQSFLQKRYQTIGVLNQAWQLAPDSFDAIPLPVQQIEYLIFKDNRAAIRKEFVVRNYAMVLDQMFNDARSLRNTAIYTLLSILLAITVNPLAAYALSRFKPRLSYQIIMLFMLTMAFPAMVMGIPNFLMLKRLNLLNTFWALVLPAAADGYFIFLLKGFFDSLPRELYESASLDGAGEFRLFWQFTLYLSKPILAVIALGAFNAAYRNFLFAFIVCQYQSMWTLMVHIYELMQRASLSVGYAALVIAAIPTLAVFIFFQNIIIKGIVVPMEK